MKPVPCPKGSVPVDFLRPKLSVQHTKHDVISILMNKYTYTDMYIINKRPKGPHIVHLSTTGHLLEEYARAAILLTDDPPPPKKSW